jgi:prevent-host-death family protein
MPTVINVKTLRQELQRILQRVRRGERFTVLYRSRPAFQIVPVDGEALDSGRLDEDPIYKAGAVGRSKDGRTAADHDEILYGELGR